MSSYTEKTLGKFWFLDKAKYPRLRKVAKQYEAYTKVQLTLALTRMTREARSYQKLYHEESRTDRRLRKGLQNKIEELALENSSLVLDAKHLELTKSRLAKDLWTMTQRFDEVNTKFDSVYQTELQTQILNGFGSLYRMMDKPTKWSRIKAWFKREWTSDVNLVSLPKQQTYHNMTSLVEFDE